MQQRHRVVGQVVGALRERWVASSHGPCVGGARAEAHRLVHHACTEPVYLGHFVHLSLNPGAVGCGSHVEFVHDVQAFFLTKHGLRVYALLIGDERLCSRVVGHCPGDCCQAARANPICCLRGIDDRCRSSPRSQEFLGLVHHLCAGVAAACAHNTHRGEQVGGVGVDGFKLADLSVAVSVRFVEQQSQRCFACHAAKGFFVFFKGDIAVGVDVQRVKSRCQAVSQSVTQRRGEGVDGVGQRLYRRGRFGSSVGLSLCCGYEVIQPF